MLNSERTKKGTLPITIICYGINQGPGISICCYNSCKYWYHISTGECNRGSIMWALRIVLHSFVDMCG